MIHLRVDFLMQIAVEIQRVNLNGHFNVIRHRQVALRRIMWYPIHSRKRAVEKKGICSIMRKIAGKATGFYKKDQSASKNRLEYRNESEDVGDARTQLGR